MTWHQHLKDVHAHLKKTNPNATLKQAMLEGRGSYRAMKDRLYDARQTMVSAAATTTSHLDRNRIFHRFMRSQPHYNDQDL
jgi:hypothetical protein